MKQKVRCCYGISSKVQNSNKHIFMMDYDNKNINDIIIDLKRIQENIYLSEIYIIKSMNGFNALSIDCIMPYRIFTEGNDNLSCCDRKFVIQGNKQGFYTLRFGSDKKLYKILPSFSDIHEKSLAHKLFLEWFFDIKINNNTNINEMPNINIIRYSNSKYGYHLIECD
jgi:hypothetical protein